MRLVRKLQPASGCQELLVPIILPAGQMSERQISIVAPEPVWKEDPLSTVQQQSEAAQVPNMAGKVMTVRGPIEPSQLGVTLPHEHIFSDISKFLLPTYYTPATEMALWEENQELTLENLHVARDLFKPLREISVYSDEDLAISEATYYRDAGGNTIVDLTSKGIRPDPLALRRVSYATGLNVVMGSGWYVKDYHPDDMDERTVEALTDEIVRDITVGA